MRLFIPEIGTKLVLTRDWLFDLYDESRNERLFEELHLVAINNVEKDKIVFANTRILNDGNFSFRKGWRSTSIFDCSGKKVSGRLEEYFQEEYFISKGDCIVVTLPERTELTVDRIYIRKGSSSFSSVSFYAKHESLGKKKVRFWAKLEDVNQIECTVVE